MNKPQLISKIPGIEVRLTPNPLRCETIFTESAKREIILMIALENVLDHMYSAKYDLEKGEDRLHHKTKEMQTPQEQALGEMNYIIDKWLVDGKDQFEIYKDLAHAWDHYIDELNGEHSGDCTSIACSCSRCHIDHMIGVDTLPLGKGAGHYLWGIYSNSPEVTAEDAQRLVDQKIRIAEFNKKYPEHSQHVWSAEELAKHESRWNSHRQTALDYYEQHKKLYAEQQSRLHQATSETP